MKVAMWYNNHDIRLEEASTPEPGPGQIVVKVASCGICGSDIVEWYRLPRAPLVQGHEISGTVVALGPGVAGVELGRRVALAPKVPCLKCYHCLKGHHPVCTHSPGRVPGGFAEYVLVPEGVVKTGLYRLPDSLDFDRATFIEPLACVVRSQRLAGLEPGQRVLVLGCGMSGLLQIKLAKSIGCRVWAQDLNPARLELAARAGAERLLNPADGEKEQEADKADAVILCTSALSAVDQAWQSVDRGGVVVFFAVPGPDKQVTVPINSFWTREIRIITSYYCGPDDMARALDLLASGQVEVADMISHRLPLAEIAQGFELVLAGRDSMKVIIQP